MLIIMAGVDTETQFPVLEFIILLLSETDVERGFYQHSILYMS